MMGKWNHELKLSIIVGILYYRIEELGFDPYDGANLAGLDFVRPSAGGRLPGWTSLLATLMKFFVARDIDRNRPYDTASSFRDDAALLMSELEESGHVFGSSARHTALSVVERVLCAHGLRAKLDAKFAWEEDVRRVPLRASVIERARRYRDLLLAHWEQDALLPASGLWPKEYFAEPVRWSRTIGLVIGLDS